MNWDPERL